jgi:hypothetical protein
LKEKEGSIRRALIRNGMKRGQRNGNTEEKDNKNTEL